MLIASPIIIQEMYMHMNAAQFTHRMKEIGLGKMTNSPFVIVVCTLAFVWAFAYRDRIMDGLFGSTPSVVS
jgi:hypothetical protein